jgi:hypothetical protein
MPQPLRATVAASAKASAAQRAQAPGFLAHCMALSV